VVRQRSAKPLFIGSIPIAASITLIELDLTATGYQPQLSTSRFLGHMLVTQHSENNGILGDPYTLDFKN
jgi:hypothetical protein